MNIFRRKSLYAAVQAGLGNVGATMVYPYAQSGFRVENKVVKVRFVEGRNAAEVQDFDLAMDSTEMVNIDGREG